jgi:hypothetical protein
VQNFSVILQSHTFPHEFQRVKTTTKTLIKPYIRHYVHSTAQHNNIKLTGIMRTQDWILKLLSEIPEVLLPHVIKGSMTLV